MKFSCTAKIREKIYLRAYYHDYATFIHITFSPRFNNEEMYNYFTVDTEYEIKMPWEDVIECS